MNNSKPKITIDLTAVAENYEIIRSKAFNAKIGATVKADCYGLGMDKIVPILYSLGCRDFFVANCDEGKLLRKIIKNEGNIYIFLGVMKDELSFCSGYNLIPVLNNLEQIKLFHDYAKGLERILPCVLHFDTGMNRLGIKKTDAAQLDLSALKNLDVRYVMSHLASSEDNCSKQNQQQLDEFKNVTSFFPNCKKSLANSSGICLSSEYHFDLVRPGAALYGIDPTPYLDQKIFKPVLGVHAPIIQIADILPGEYVGYNATFCNESERTMRLATVAIGYADGLICSLSNKGYMMIKGHHNTNSKEKCNTIFQIKCNKAQEVDAYINRRATSNDVTVKNGNWYKAPIVGKISMDLTTIDVSHIPPEDIIIGDMAEIIGPNLSIAKIANLAGTSSYEMLTSLLRSVRF